MLNWLVLLTLSWSVPPHTTRRIVLEGQWTVLGAGKGHNVTVHTNSGLDQYSTLWSAGVRGDPLQDIHETDYRKDGTASNWTFIHRFRLKQDFEGRAVGVELQWDGIDTFCDIHLNERLVGSSDNSFIENTWPIGGLVEWEGINTLRLECKSTSLVARQLAKKRLAQGCNPAPPDCWPDNIHGECHVNMVRTTQASFGWDWGPTFPIQGFWHVPRLIVSFAPWRFGSGFKFFSHTSSKWDEGTYNVWDVHAMIEVIHLSNMKRNPQTDWFCISFSFDNWYPSQYAHQCFIGSSKDVYLTLMTNQTGLVAWWPHGIRTGPRTYRLRLMLSTLEGHILDRAEHVVGFREVELIERPVLPQQPNMGFSFYLQINGLPIFAKGTNWIPSKLLPGRGSGFMRNRTGDAHWEMRRLLRSARLAGINLIRVWGGGRYEPEEFYAEASRLGLMIWQDMMFAVSTYPDPESLDVLNTMEREIRQQVRRLHSHPCIVVWATDNEVKEAISSNWYPGVAPTVLLAAYQARFVDSMTPIILSEEQDTIGLARGYRSRRCLVSSPSNGILTENKRAMDKNPSDPRYGDVHLYVYSGNLWSEKSYLVTRFTSEFGIQSLPSVLAWQRSLSRPDQEANWNVTGKLMSQRQHHSLGVGLFQLVAEHVGLPFNGSSNKDQYRRWAYLTQLNQMVSYQVHINRLMRHQCRLADTDVLPSEFSSMGAAYWQLNDVWSAPTWSTIDSAGLWKMAHHGAVKQCFDPKPFGRVAINVNQEEQVVQADWIPPGAGELRPAVGPESFIVQCFTTTSFKPLGSAWKITPDFPTHNLTCPVIIMNLTFNALKERCGWNYNESAGHILSIRMQKSSYFIPGGSFALLELPVNIHWVPRTREQRLRVLNLIEIPIDSINTSTIQAPFMPSRVFRLTVRASLPELFVWMELDPELDVDYWFDPNAFSLYQDRQKRLNLYLSEDGRWDTERIRSGIQMLSLSSVREATDEKNMTHITAR